MTAPTFTNLPKHIAVIMDGNGRWAKAKGLPRSAGHKAGAKALENFIEYAGELGISYVTVYAFSSENWSRPQDEVATLMDLLRSYLKNELKSSAKHDVRYRFIGDLSPLASDIKDLITKLEQDTKDKTGLNLNVALSYGSKDEIIAATKSIATDVANGKLSPKDITEDLFATRLWSYPAPYPDLLIRTSGEKRLSNFLLWQSAYTELIFTDTLWPDFAKSDLDKAIAEFQNRSRRFGRL